MSKTFSAALRDDFAEISAVVSPVVDPVERWQYALDDLGVLAPVPELVAHLIAAPKGVPQEDLQLLADVIGRRGRPGGLAATTQP